MVRMKDWAIELQGLENPRTLGERLNRARVEACMHPHELAEKIGKTRSSVAQYESDKVSPPLAVIKDLATALDVAPEYLAYGLDRGDIHDVDSDKVAVPISTSRKAARAYNASVDRDFLRDEFGISGKASILQLAVAAPAFGFKAGDFLLLNELCRLSNGNNKLYAFKSSAGIIVMRSEVQLAASADKPALRDGDGHLLKPEKTPKALGEVVGLLSRV